MAGRHGIRGRWSDREEARSSSYSIHSSSTSGTFSTAYTSSGSHMSSGYYLASAMDLDFELERAKAVKKEEQIKHIKSLVQEFFGRGEFSVTERWLTELGIGWVLHLPLAHDAASAGELGQTYDALITCWIRALAQVVEIIGYTQSLFPEQAASQLSHIFEEEEQALVLDQWQFAEFVQQAVFKMLPFVDWIVSEVLVASSGIKMEPPNENLSTLLGVYGALSKALPQIQLAPSLPQFQLASSLMTSTEVLRIQHHVVSLLAAKEVKVCGAIWRIMKDIRTRILEPMDDSSGTATLEGSSDIHKATRSLISYIELLRANYSSLAPVVSVNYESHNAAVPPLDSMIIEIASCLEEKLAKESESFPDRTLRFLFLFNNSYLISQKVDPIWSVIEFNHVAANSNSFLSFIKAHQETTTRKVQSYMESYLQASWAPLLSCLFNNPTPLCLVKNKIYSQLTKFESEFQKTYTTQKLWKVPDPGLRKSLRKAITMEIIPDYTKYIEDNSITTPRIAPHEMEEMLQELFEG